MCGAAEGGAGCTGDSRVVDARGSARAARHGWSGAQGPSWAEERSPQQRHAPPPARLLRPRLRSASSPASDVMRGPWACGAWGACANPPSPTAAARLGEPSRLGLTRGAPHPTPPPPRSGLLGPATSVSLTHLEKKDKMWSGGHLLLVFDTWMRVPSSVSGTDKPSSGRTGREGKGQCMV